MSPLRALTEWCCGSTLLSLEGDPLRAVNALLLAGLDYRPVPPRGDADAPHRISVRRSEEAAVLALFERYEIPYTLLRRRGLPALLRRCRARPGLFLGLLLFGAILFFSGRFVWDVRVVSPDGLPEEKLLSMLAEEGVIPGAYLPALDFHAICRQFPARHPEVSWLSVNMMGTVAEIEVRAYDPGGEESPPKRSLKALVAGCDGVVERMEIYGGSAVCAVGQPVFKGTLLVSCVVENSRGTFLEDACGRVFAKVTELYSAEVPFLAEETLDGEPLLLEKSLFLFGKRINFPKRGSNLEGNYAIIEKSRRPLLFGLRLPVTLTERFALPVNTRTRLRSREEALALAESELAETLEKALGDCDVLASESEISESADGVRITRQVTLLRDIATPIEIGFAENKE